MATMKGQADFKRYMQSIPADLETKILRGAAKAAGNVIMDEAKLQTRSEDVREGLRMRTAAKDGVMRVTIDIKPGWARSLAIWEEYSTQGHFISVDDSQRNGMSVNRINRTDKAAREAGKIGSQESLVIGGEFVGKTVWHPGASANPFLRPSLDLKGDEAIAAAQNHINIRISQEGFGPPVSEDMDE